MWWRFCCNFSTRSLLTWTKVTEGVFWWEFVSNSLLLSHHSSAYIITIFQALLNINFIQALVIISFYMPQDQRAELKRKYHKDAQGAAGEESFVVEEAEEGRYSEGACPMETSVDGGASTGEPSSAVNSYDHYLGLILVHIDMDLDDIIGLFFVEYVRVEVKRFSVDFEFCFSCAEISSQRGGDHQFDSQTVPALPSCGLDRVQPAVQSGIVALLLPVGRWRIVVVLVQSSNVRREHELIRGVLHTGRLHWPQSSGSLDEASGGGRRE